MSEALEISGTLHISITLEIMGMVEIPEIEIIQID